MCMMEDLNDEDLFDTPPACLCLNKSGKLVKVQTKFFKKEVTRKAVLSVEYNHAPKNLEIDHTWSYAITKADPNTVCIGCFVPGVKNKKMMLKFDNVNHLNQFMATFNRCIDFSEKDTEEKIERNFEYKVTRVTLKDVDADDEEAEDTVPDDMYEREIQMLLNSDDPAPKFNHYIIPSIDKIHQYPTRVNLGVSKEGYANYLDQHVNDELKPHWRGCPGIVNAPLGRQPYDPIFKSDQYNLTGNRTRPPPQPFQAPPSRHASHIGDDDPDV